MTLEPQDIDVGVVPPLSQNDVSSLSYHRENPIDL